MKKFSKSGLRLKTLLLCGGFAPLQAAELYGSWYWHAFASQGTVYTSDNEFLGSSDDSLSSEFRDLGLILGGQPLSGLNLVGQLLSRKAGGMDDGRVRVDYAFGSYTFFADPDWTVGVKAGRIRAPFAFYNETRDVAHTRSSILLPQSVYVDRLRNLSFARDGVQLFGSFQYELSTLSWDLAYGKTILREADLPEVASGNQLAGAVDTPYTPIARVIWDWDMGRVRLGLTYSPLEYDYEAAAVDIFSSDTLRLTNWVASAEYNAASWSLISEYSYYDNDLGSLLSKFYPDVNFNSQGEAYYIQGSYRFAPKWDVFVRCDVQYLDKERRKDEGFFSRDRTLGIGWRPDEYWLLRAEWHNVRGTSWLSSRETPPQEASPKWHMILFQVSYRI